jgi:ribosome biogenesis protein
MEASTSEGDEILVRFVTSIEKIKVPAAPITVPSNLNRHGLSQIINHLLGQSSSSIEYEFFLSSKNATSSVEAINDFPKKSSSNVLLRTSMKKYISSLQVSSENTVTLEYTYAVRNPDETSSKNTNDWVSSLDGSSSFVVAGSYDGTLSVYRTGAEGAELALQSSVYAHSLAVSSVSLFEPESTTANSDNDSSPVRLVSGGKDGIVRVWSLSGSDPSNSLVLEGAEQAIASVKLNRAGDIVAAADWAGNLLLWAGEELVSSFSSNSTTSSSEIQSKKSKRARRKEESENEEEMNNSDVKTLLPVQFLSSNSSSGSNNSADIINQTSGHSCVAKSLCWTSPTAFASGSWDHKVHLYEQSGSSSGTFTLVNSISTGKAIHAVTASPMGSLIASAHSDHKIRIWDSLSRDLPDARADLQLSSTASLKRDGLRTTFLSTPSWISSLSWHVSSPFHIASSNYSGNVTLWDIRAPSSPLITLSQHQGKVFSTCWAGSQATMLVSGGETGCISNSFLKLS